MARQEGPLRLEGQMGGIIYYKTLYGYLARTKGGISKERIKKDPVFRRTRELNNEFARAGTAAKLLRTAFQPLLTNMPIGRLIARLAGKFVQVIQGDEVNKHGARNITDGKLDQLVGFEFNTRIHLERIIHIPYIIDIDKVGRTSTIIMPPFVPRQGIDAPYEATHFRLLSALAAMDFNRGRYHLNTATSKELVYGDHTQSDIKLTCNIDKGDELPLILLLGIEYLRRENGKYITTRGGSCSGLAVVAIAG